MPWPLRRRHPPEEAPAVIEAIQKRDRAFDQLDEAIEEVDRVHDRVVADYKAANGLRRGDRQ